jgi:hypothetical protein
VLPCLVRVAAKIEPEAEDALAGADIHDAQAKAAYQGADFIDLTDQHSVRVS